MTDGLLHTYEKARKEAMENKVRTAEIAAANGLSPALSAMLNAVIHLWPGDKDSFFATMEGIYADARNAPADRAMAAEHASSCFQGDDRLAWSERALELVPDLGTLDGELLTLSTYFGLWDSGLKPYTAPDIHEALGRLIEMGAYNAPGRVKWWLSVLDLEREADRAVAVHWLSQVVARDNSANNCNVFYMGWCRKKLEELQTAQS